MNKHRPARKKGLNRRTFLSNLSGAAAGSLGAGALLRNAGAFADPAAAVYQATGTRVGEATENSAIVWTRLTANPSRVDGGITFRQQPAKVDVPVEKLEGACPGAAGRVRVRYGRQADFSDAQTTDWVAVDEQHDFIHHFRLTGLEPDTVYYYESQGAAPDSSTVVSTHQGQFATAPKAAAPSELRFCVMTCQGYPDRGHPDGHPIYPSMQALKPRFACLTGDLVYYDNDAPKAVTPRLARYHWERMFSLPRLLEFTRSVGGYWQKDDHDTLSNDCWPGMLQGELTYAEGQQIFREQAPWADGPAYRTVRWGRDLQIWFTDSRDFRSRNSLPDGPAKTIWGPEQKAWFKESVAQSNATWKILVTPNPIVGPDRPKKNDNHANAGFAHEGDEIRSWLKEHVPDNFFSICGDRHWQFHSVHPTTGVHEFSVGPASNEHTSHAQLDKKYHKFYRVGGGFLSVDLKPTKTGSSITFQLHDVAGKVVYEYQRETQAAQA